MKTEGLKIFLVYAMLCLIWGSTWLAIRFGLESLTPIYSAGLRFSMASLFILVLMKIRGVSLQLDKVSIRLYLIMGLLSFVIPFGLVYWAEQFVPSGIASVLFAVFPFFVAIFSFLFIAEETIGIYKIFGITIGFIGITIIFSDSLRSYITDYLLGMIAIILSAIMQASIAVTIKKYGHHLNPLAMNLVPMIIAGISMTVIGLLIEDTSKNRFDLNAILSILYLAFFGSLITFTSYYWLLKKINIVILSLTAFITPITALILGFLFYNEQLSNKHFIGAALVLMGVLVANLRNLLKIRKAVIIKSDA